MMRSIWIAWILLILIAVGISANSLYLSHEIRILQETADAICPDEAQDTELRQKNGELCRILSEHWDKLFPYLTYVCSYAELNRADEAVSELSSAVETDNYSDAVTAKRRLKDALRRLYELESLSFGAVF